MFCQQILKNYVRKQAFFAILGAIVGLTLLKSFFDYLSQIEDINSSYNYLDALYYIVLSTPQSLQFYMPIGAMVGAVIGLGLLANNSELTVIQAAGLSRFRIVSWVMQPAMIFVLIGLLLSQFVIPTTNKLAGQIKSQQVFISTALNGYWQKTDDQIIHIDYADTQGKLKNIKIWQLTKGELKSVIRADTGNFYQFSSAYDPNVYHAEASGLHNKSGWVLNNVQQINIHADNTSSLTTHKQLFAKLPIEPGSIYLLTLHPADMSLSDLLQHQRLLAKDNHRSLIHEVTFWQKLLSPFAVLSLVLVACSFVFGSLRSQSLGFRLVLALLVGLLFSYTQDLVGFISLSTEFSPLFMVLLPIVLSATIGIYLVKRNT
ncbi:putative ABC transporter permease YjgP/YjgQ [Moraxella macacae 0408225]|uniref:Putative ABC transporter permease YjgP/YjgQ n=1 Tax=Moraxella macacae 0408225 TaxID=1230338 RepID=L2F8Y4_9GAMM|nr:LptF/LptG family permease [Moraxella macacae]ELA09497.1 putative ABC transporter permease YjgP/YjgQ [Moraxella macacae 0408225]